MTRPRIYGDEARFRTALTRAIRSGEALLAQSEGYRRRMKLAEGSPLDVLTIEKEWEAAFRRWFMGTGNALFKFLQEQLNPSWNAAAEDEHVLPTLSNGLPPDDDKPRHRIGIDNGEEWLSKTLDELRALAVEIKPPTRARMRPRRESFLSKPVVGLAATVFFGVIAIILVYWH